MIQTYLEMIQVSENVLKLLTITYLCYSMVPVLAGFRKTLSVQWKNTLLFVRCIGIILFLLCLMQIGIWFLVGNLKTLSDCFGSPVYLILAVINMICCICDDRKHI